MRNLDALTVIYIAITAVSAVSLIGPTLKYVEFYKTIQQFDLAVSSIHVTVSPEQGKVTMSINFTAINNSTYTGLTLTNLNCYPSYEDGEHTIEFFMKGYGTIRYETTWWKLQGRSCFEPLSLAPHSNRSISMIFISDGDHARHFIGYFGHNHECINWKLYCRVYFPTFIGLSLIDFTIYHKSD